MTDMRRMLSSLGWTDQKADLLPDNLIIMPDPLELEQTPAQWKTAMATTCVEILEERACHLPASTASKPATSSSFIPNNV
jgi:hypothetical protein